MNKKADLLRLIPEQGILPLYFYKDTEVSLQVLRALYNAGIRTVEYTNRGKAALQNFKKMRKLCDTEFKGMYLGIGIAGWFKVGVCAVGMGSKLISMQLVEQKDYAKIGELTKEAMDIVKSVR